MVESILHVNEKCCGLKKAEVSDKKQVLRSMTCTELGGTDDPQVTIDMLPDNVLLETFEFYLGKDDPDVVVDYGHGYDKWQTLVHVCRKWRCIVFTSPRRLDLKLKCTPQRLGSVNSTTLDIWPTFPIVIFSSGHGLDMKSQEDGTNVIAVLRHHNRVCKIHCDPIQDSLLKEFAAKD